MDEIRASLHAAHAAQRREQDAVSTERAARERAESKLEQAEAAVVAAARDADAVNKELMEENATLKAVRARVPGSTSKGAFAMCVPKKLNQKVVKGPDGKPVTTGVSQAWIHTCALFPVVGGPMSVVHVLAELVWLVAMLLYGQTLYATLYTLVALDTTDECPDTQLCGDTVSNLFMVSVA